MEEFITNHLSSLEFRDVQQFENMTLLPLFSSVDHGPQYLTLGEAMESGVLTVEEINQGGSVPHLSAINAADLPILLLDGEELIGAKQNRVVNTTILLKEKSETVVPVSCTEQGRWSYVSRTFSDSEVVLSHDIRKRKAASVNRSLEQRRSYASDQSEIWSEIREMSTKAGVSSPTGAMKDVYETRKHTISECLEAFPYVPGQRGLLVFANGHITGLDFLSSESGYEKLHGKLVKSYAMDALLRNRGSSGMPDLAGAKEFVISASSAREAMYDSVGHGKDHRYEGDSIVGSALVHDGSVIHMAFFSTEGDETNMSNVRRRMGYRS